MAEEKEKDIDTVDVISLAAAIIATTSAFAATGTLFWGVVYGAVYGLQHWIRRTDMARRFSQRITDDYPKLENVAPLLLPGPKEQEVQEFSIRQDKPLDVRVINDVDPYEDKPFWERATKPLPGQQVLSGTTQQRKTTQFVNTQIAHLQRALKRLPKYVPFTALPTPPSPLCVPVGIDSIDGTVLWGDFSSDGNLIHALIAGQTGSGKDALLRLWFTTLTVYNKPNALQFVILDGKGVDWLSPELAASAYMAIKPAGGIDIRKVNGKWQNIEQEAMAGNLAWIFEELNRRGDLMNAIGAIDIAGYNRKSDIKLPYIFVLASDVGDTFNNDLELLVKWLIARGRSYGVRLLISMQNPVGESTKWRSQIGLVMSGYQQNPDQDRYIMGINVDRLLVRPSQLPNPEENDISKGLFVVRHGSMQHLVRTAHMPEEDWFRYIKSVLPKKREWQDMQYSNRNSDLLTHLLNAPEDTIHIPTRVKKQPVEVKKPILTQTQISTIAQCTQQGYGKTDIMQRLGFTNGLVYREKSHAVDIIIAAVKRKM